MSSDCAEKIVNQVKEELRLPSQYEAALLEVVDNLERCVFSPTTCYVWT